MFKLRYRSEKSQTHPVSCFYDIFIPTNIYNAIDIYGVITLWSHKLLSYNNQRQHEVEAEKLTEYWVEVAG